MKPVTGLAAFVARLFTNDYRDLFMVRLGSQLILSKFGLVGPAADFVGFFLRAFIGFVAETGIYQIDLAIVSLREGMKLADFEKDAAAAYKKATAKIYDEEKKNAIRKEYLEIISQFGNVGDRPR